MSYQRIRYVREICIREAVGLPGCLPKVKLSAQLRENDCRQRVLTVVAKALSGRADLGVVTNIATFVAGAAG